MLFYIFYSNLITCFYFRFETDFDYECILPINQCITRACAIGVTNIEHSHFVQVMDCVCDYNHPDIGALLVFMKYFTQKDVFYLLLSVKMYIFENLLNKTIDILGTNGKNQVSTA